MPRAFLFLTILVLLGGCSSRSPVIGTWTCDMLVLTFSDREHRTPDGSDVMAPDATDERVATYGLTTNGVQNEGFYSLWARDVYRVRLLRKTFFTDQGHQAIPASEADFVVLSQDSARYGDVPCSRIK